MTATLQPAYAQTNLQLFEQMRRQGYGAADLAVIDGAYHFAMQLFSGQYRASGKPFLCHLVGTASVLASLSAPTPVVATGLLHSVYTLGWFGSGWLGMSPVKRGAVQERVGREIEERVKRYTELIWDEETPAQLVKCLSRRESIDSDTVLVRLANEMDDHLDLGILYCGEATERLRRAGRIRQPCVDLASALGYPSLSEALAQTLGRCASGLVEADLRQRVDFSFTIPPRSRTRWRLWRLRNLWRRPRSH